MGAFWASLTHPFQYPSIYLARQILPGGAAHPSIAEDAGENVLVASQPLQEEALEHLAEHVLEVSLAVGLGYFLELGVEDRPFPQSGLRGSITLRYWAGL